MSSQSSHHPQEVLLAQFSLYVHKGGLKPDSFHFISFLSENITQHFSVFEVKMTQHISVFEVKMTLAVYGLGSSYLALKLLPYYDK